MLKTINIMLHETGMDKNGPIMAGYGRTVTELAAIHAIAPDKADEEKIDFTVLTPIQELAVDAMAYIQTAVLPRAKDDGKSLPVMTNSLRTDFEALSVTAINQVKAIYTDVGRNVQAFYPNEAIKLVRKFCEEVIRLTRMKRCLVNPIRKNLRIMINTAGGADLAVEDLFNENCMPIDIATFYQDDITTAVGLYRQKKRARHDDTTSN